MTKVFADADSEGTLTVSAADLISDKTYETLHGPLLYYLLDGRQLDDIQQAGRQHLVDVLVIRAKRLHRRGNR
jgi:hypothetical protein